MRLRSSTLLSLAIHGAVLWSLQAVARRSRAEVKVAPIEVAILEKPVVPPAPPSLPPEAPKEAPKLKPVVVKKLSLPPPPPPTPAPVREPEPPPPPPAGFSLDAKEVAPASQSGVAVPAVEGGGNLFADPQRKDLPAGPKTTSPPPAPPPPRPVPIYEVTRRPELLSETEMTGFYTEEAKELGIEGSVLIELQVRADGTVTNPRVVRGLGHGLDQNALRVARSLRFRPAYRGNEPVPVWITVPFAFRLED